MATAAEATRRAEDAWARFNVKNVRFRIDRRDSPVVKYSAWFMVIRFNDSPYHAFEDSYQLTGRQTVDELADHLRETLVGWGVQMLPLPRKVPPRRDSCIVC